MRLSCELMFHHIPQLRKRNIGSGAKASGAPFRLQEDVCRNFLIHPLKDDSAAYMRNDKADFRK
ncbi:hypothetical protein PO124_31305 [Bacillus licheniformis]|nr:hypothetical protein [Bacillus licheniformis]